MRKTKRAAALLSALALVGAGLSVAASPASAEPTVVPVKAAAPPSGDSLTQLPKEKPGEIFKKIQAANPGLTLAEQKAKFVKSPSKVPQQRLGGTPVKGMPQRTPQGGISTQSTTCASLCYLYNGGRQDIASTITGGANYRGVSTQSRIGGDPGTLDLRKDFHSLGELAVHGANGGNLVEIGWTVAPGLNGDYDATLFVFSWVNGVPGCYNLTCGDFAQAIGSPFTPGVSKLTVGGNYTFSYYHDTTPGVEGWWASVGSNWIGYFPDYLWANATPAQTFLTAPFTQIFFEVATSVQEPCSDMGNGELGASATASRFGQVAYYNSAGTITTTGVNLSTFRQAANAPNANAAAPYYNTFGEGPAGAQRAFRAGGGGWNFAGTALGANGTCN